MTIPTDWVSHAADQAIQHAGEGNLVTCASGISPSGPIHLGNLREFLTVHFVAEEIARRGVPVRHLQSWDDYDRFRKVPVGVDKKFNEHIGRPLSAVPDPWQCHKSWAEHFKAPLRAALAELGCEMVEVSQTEQYTSGAYQAQILEAVARRDEIDAVLAKYRTKQADPGEANEDQGNDCDPLSRFPYKPYCRQCTRDTVTITAYDDVTTDLLYTCIKCGYQGVTNLRTQHEGKLVWKIDWPMRWAYEKVNFEPAGADHSSPGSSFTVGHHLVEQIWGYPKPTWFGYSFVGFAGMSKMSSSKGGVPTATDALSVMEAPILRWLYVRRQPKQSFNIDFGQEILRLYDEWDALGRKAADPTKRDAAVLAYERATVTASAGPLPRPQVTVPFRLLSSVADITAGSADQISRIVAAAGYPHHSVAELEPRLQRAMAWMSEFVAEDERTTVRVEADYSSLAALTEHQASWLNLLLEHLPDEPALESLTSLVYGVPKLALGMAIEDAPNDQVKADQREFFRLLYRLLVDAERGPRLPTLMLALGAAKVRSLLGQDMSQA
jgi:lysyl-tRNA synthetase, class I